MATGSLFKIRRTKSLIINIMGFAQTLIGLFSFKRILRLLIALLYVNIVYGKILIFFTGA
ncbi:membrane protein [Clostridium acetobutylicum EA 2018]|uniref:Predicted membrane protein n=1 Tax=Clostridium acetobutylicum (strain ATCC 824 / DSM 792 / JCM 1419 / IAM 19013 / LMG 5710 / NBRC 13948 / NRRL B-527 / VKM B-1787 / 2291 / W) TaxID=272562 RepID=Q97EU5_CLOAB|nr:Predicted membrane protein [Clostridium acetobutylicum ATCC 824]ADZ22054.1 membrane protein [Clostridium acetobutylicum EA 2018]AEI32646.1 hypothetical protein SMB_G3047 [Clostridium acetobutylicum DSM 1731]AWV78637.1 hypothetical protein DK921_00630 [Clostridium acetobutylicum]PSM06597.1 hypothetical protein C7T89_00630 [Clostridium sp. NJ4]